MLISWLVAAHAEETIGSGVGTEALTFAPPPDFRVVLDQRVQLPAALWFTTDFNRQVRVMRYHLGLVLECATAPSPDGIEVDCRAVDAAIAADAFEDGGLQPILDELDQKLTGARVVVQLTREGQVDDVALHEAGVRSQVNRRVNEMHENLRLMVRKALLGLEMPQDQTPGATAWTTHRTELMQTVSSSGTAGRMRTVHELYAAPGDLVLVRSSGRGVGAPAMGELLLPFEVQLESVALYDPRRAMLTERLWTVTAVPTASNPLAEGFSGVPGRAESSLRVLGALEQVELFPSTERPPVMGVVP